MSFPITQTIISPTGTTVIPGQNIVYKIVITNNSSSPLTLKLYDLFPAGTSFVSLKLVSLNGAIINTNPIAITVTTIVGSTGAVDLSTSTIPIGGSSVQLLTLSVDQTAIVGSVIQNQIFSLSGTFPPFGDVLQSISSPLTVVAPQADLSVSVSGFTGTNKFVTTVSNIGPSDATNVVLMEKVNSAAVKFTQLSGPIFTLPSVIPTVFCESSDSNSSSAHTSEEKSESYTVRMLIPTFSAGTTATFSLSVMPKDESDEKKNGCRKENDKIKVFVQIGADTIDPNLINNVDQVSLVGAE